MRTSRRHQGNTARTARWQITTAGSRSTNRRSPLPRTGEGVGGEVSPMNGIHDLGGMRGCGPVETDEPVPPTLEWWEAAVIALSQVGRGQIGGSRLWNIDESRYAIERMGNAEY